MTNRKTLVDGLRNAGVNIDATNTTRVYTDGVAYVLTQPAALTERRTYTVVAAVNVGQDLDAYADKVTAAITAIAGMVSLSYTPEYSAVPVPGREMPPADLCRIIVASDQLWH